MVNENTSLGKASLWTSIVGVLLPVVLAILIAVFFQPRNEEQRHSFQESRQWANALCGVLFVVLELVALGCGIAGRRTATGKAGLVISTILLLLFSYVLWEWLRPRESSLIPPEADRNNQAPNEPEFRGQADKAEKGKSDK